MRHILMKTNELADDATVQQKLTALRERILQGRGLRACSPRPTPRTRAPPRRRGSRLDRTRQRSSPSSSSVIDAPQGQRDQRAVQHPVRLAHRAGARPARFRQHRRAEAPARVSMRSAPARRTRRPSCGCAVCATKPTSSTSPERCDSAHRVDVRRTRRHRPGAVSGARARASWPCELVCLADRRCSPSAPELLGLQIELRALSGRGGRPRRARARRTAAVAHAAARSPERRRAARRLRMPPTCSQLSTARSTARSAGSSPHSSRPRCTRASSTRPASPSPATPSISPRAPMRPHPVMLLTAGELRVALATTHLPLEPSAPRSASIGSRDTASVLRARPAAAALASSAPRIAVCGLNPHAGEGGHLGDEELTRDRVRRSQRMRRAASRATGPLPADTAFVPQVLARFDAVLAMYHDQGLPVVKHAGFDHAVNVTLGLPIVRTSVDHGTALDLAGTGRADPAASTAAVRLASSPARSAWRRAARRGTARRAASDSASISCTTRRVIERIVRALAPQRGRSPGGDRPGARRAHPHLLGAAGTTLDAIEIDRDLRARAARRVRRMCRAVSCTRAMRSSSILRALARARGGTAAHRRQPALQHLHAAAVPSARPGGGIADLHFMLQREVVARMAGRARQPATTAGSP